MYGGKWQAPAKAILQNAYLRKMCFDKVSCATWLRVTSWCHAVLHVSYLRTKTSHFKTCSQEYMCSSEKPLLSLSAQRGLWANFVHRSCHFGKKGNIYVQNLNYLATNHTNDVNKGKSRTLAWGLELTNVTMCAETAGPKKSSQIRHTCAHVITNCTFVACWDMYHVEEARMTDNHKVDRYDINTYGNQHADISDRYVPREHTSLLNSFINISGQYSRGTHKSPQTFPACTQVCTVQQSCQTNERIGIYGYTWHGQCGRCKKG